jgi:methylglutaconyl-CoA hydratase
MVFLARQIGERRAKRLLLSGRAVGPEEAVALGLADRAVSTEDLMDQALGEALALQRGAPGALALTKAVLWRTSGVSLNAAVDWAAQINSFARTDPDMREGLEAFFGGRKPNWSPP